MTPGGGAVSGSVPAATASAMETLQHTIRPPRYAIEPGSKHSYARERRPTERTSRAESESASKSALDKRDLGADAQDVIVHLDQ